MDRSGDENDGMLYYDSLEFFPADDDFGVWLNEPRSVNERRRDFYAKMGCGLGNSNVVSTSLEETKFIAREAHGSEATETAIADASSSFREEVHDMAFEIGSFTGGKRAKSGWWNNIVKRMKNRIERNEKSMKKRNAANAEQELDAHNGAVWTMKFSPDGQYLASGGEDGVVRIWRIDDSSRSIFRVEESPTYELRGHRSDILDLSWSTSNRILSSSTDGTVRLWKLGSTHCLEVFRHNNYVTCVQYNPVDENNFVTGSVDGIVRIWGVREKRVVDWAAARDIITALSYQPDGNGIIVGGISGSCRFYQCEAGTALLVQAVVPFRGRRINGIKFEPGSAKRAMISCDDFKLRVFDGVKLVHTFKAIPKSGSQMCGSLTFSDRHLISAGDDSRVYMWNHDELFRSPPTGRKKSLRACEYFSSPQVSVAIPWSCTGNVITSEMSTVKTTAGFRRRNCLIPRGNSATWPEESLGGGTRLLPRVIVTASLNGKIRTYHKFGLPTNSVQLQKNDK